MPLKGPVRSLRPINVAYGLAGADLHSSFAYAYGNSNSRSHGDRYTDSNGNGYGNVYANTNADASGGRLSGTNFKIPKCPRRVHLVAGFF